MKRFAKLQTADLFAAVEASICSIKQQLENMQSSVKKAIEAKSQIEEGVGKDPTNKKFLTFKAAGGSVDDFFKGLEDRIGDFFFAFRIGEGDVLVRRPQSRLQKSDVCRAYHAGRKHFHIHHR